MKKFTILLSLALVAMLSSVGFAQLNTDITGSFETEIVYNDGLSASGVVKAELKATTGNDRVVIALGTVASVTGDDSFLADPFNPAASNLVLNITNAKVILNGAWFEGGPEVTTTIGRHNVSYSPWVASHQSRTFNQPGVMSSGNPGHSTLGRNGIEVSGLDLGPLSLSVYHGWSAPNESASYGPDPTYVSAGPFDPAPEIFLGWNYRYGQDNPTAFRVQGDLAVLGLDVVVVRRQELVDIPTGAENSPHADRDHVMDFSITGTVAPSDGVDVKAVVAQDGQNSTSAYRVDVELTTIPDITLDAAIFSAAEDFMPRYAQWTRNNNINNQRYTAFWIDQQGRAHSGFSIGGKTTQSDVELYGSYESVNRSDNANRTVTKGGASTSVQNFDVSVDVTLTNAFVTNASTTKTEVGVGTDLAAVRVDYKGTIETGADVKNEITASTTQNLVFASAVKIQGKVVLQGTDTKTAADAGWTAPNGIDLNVGWGSESGVIADNLEGFYAKAGYSVSW
jgi:hypothetical protein